ncbi:hypothetical protein AKJ36_03475 [candidate division MSBL1 archaeon SCGC-AAA259I07]|uniref:Uncharacterized protein n=1 Tax=candidate division MSBL1 archaeon SCGC-AAA259I07 TaxID=1698266 RepID=A0A133UIV3_9EURY|nr:hypothetical protein AKJ36_03475 [candidate division MSBL1 archaeon SCGC-AAA259I07]
MTTTFDLPGNFENLSHRLGGNRVQERKDLEKALDPFKDFLKEPQLQLGSIHDEISMKQQTQTATA